MIVKCCGEEKKKFSQKIFRPERFDTAFVKIKGSRKLGDLDKVIQWWKRKTSGQVFKEYIGIGWGRGAAPCSYSNWVFVCFSFLYV
jgi:hypothetical protein